MIKKNFTLSSSISLFSVWIISLFYGLLVGNGFYGFGNDYYALYFKSNLDWGGWTDYLGYRVSTLNIGGYSLGVFLTSFILAFSTGLLIRFFFKIKKLYSVFAFFFIYLLAIHTWPIIMSTSNAMRQGICMSILFLSLICINSRKVLSFFLILFSVFFHKSGQFYLFIFFYMLIMMKIINKSEKNQRILLITFGLIIFCIFSFLIFINIKENDAHRVIGGDYRLPFILINFFFIFFYTLRHDLLLQSSVNIFLYLFSFIVPGILFLQLNWQYERLNMMMLIPYILVTADFFKKSSVYLYWIMLFSILLFITINNGMYASLK